MAKVLYVEEHPGIRNATTDGLRFREYEVIDADFFKARELQRKPGLAKMELDIILAALPGREGPEVIESATKFFGDLAKSRLPVPVIIDIYRHEGFDIARLRNQFKGKNTEFTSTGLSDVIGSYDREIKEALEKKK